MIAAVTFDAGQTLLELDTAMLAMRLAERGVIATADRLAAAEAGAWRRYEQLVRGGGPSAPWQGFMAALIGGATTIDGEGCAALAAWLFGEQPRRNLWRRPIPGMIELVRALRGAGLTVGVISNAEGGLADLFDEIGWGRELDFVIDSARVGCEKPDRAIFDLALRRLGCGAGAVVHVGDSRTADVEGARGAGWRAIWFGPAVTPLADPEVAIARNAGEVAAALVRWGAPPSIAAR